MEATEPENAWMLDWSELPPLLRWMRDDPEVIAMGPFEIQHTPPLDRATAELGVQLEREWDDELNDWHPTSIHWYPYGGHGREDACHAINWRVHGDNLICDRTDTRQTVTFHAIPETTSDSYLRWSQTSEPESANP